MNHPKIRTDAAGDLYLNFGEYGQEVEVACFSGDGTRLLTVQEVGVARLWDVAEGRLVGEIRPTSPLAGSKAGPTTSPFQVFIEAAALDTSGGLALLGLNDGTAGLFSVVDGSRRTTFHHPDRPPARQWEFIRAVNFSLDGSLAAVGFYGRAVGVWDVPSGRPVAFLRSGAARRLHRPGGWSRDTLVSSVAVSPDNRFVLAGHADMTATLWELETGRVVLEACEHQEEILALWQDGVRVRWATSGGKVREAGPAGVVERLATGEEWQEAALFPDGGPLLVRTRGDRVKRWSLAGEQESLAGAAGGSAGVGCGRGPRRPLAGFRRRAVPSGRPGRAGGGGLVPGHRPPAGIFVHVGDGPRGWATPLRPSRDGRFVVLPWREGASLVELGPEPEVVSRAGCGPAASPRTACWR